MDHEFGRIDYNPQDEGTFQPNLVFVAIPFGSGFKKKYLAIKAACKELGLKTVCVNENTGSSFIIKEITDLIEQAEFIIFDLTMERPNVYYELGYAHGVGNEPLDILLMAESGTKLHFDISAIRVHFYSSLEGLNALIKKELYEMMKLTRS